MRIERDFLGDTKIPDNALYGIHSVRAKNNFQNDSQFDLEWYKALGITKKAVYLVYNKYKKAVLTKYPQINNPVQFIDDKVLDALIAASNELAEGKHSEHFIVPAIQGGAGTSINLNINEIIANRALILLERKAGEYNIIDPIENANIFQSTNDVIPTSLRIAIMRLLNNLEESINLLRSRVETYEKENRFVLRIAYTQMQEAVPSTYGRLFSTYIDALSRDWWRVSKCSERIKVVNLGGTAIGSGITVPRFYIMEVVSQLQELTKLPLTRGENLMDATANLDSFVEIHATLKAHAINLEKMVNDIRILASDLVDKKEMSIPKKQLGSTIMPSKVNPVIPEFVVSIAHQVYSNDMLITGLSAQGCLDLNAYIPIIGHSILQSLKLLISANTSLFTHLFSWIVIDSKLSEEKLFRSPVITTALIPYIGYNRASELANKMKSENCNIFEANSALKILDHTKLENILSPSNLLKAGYSVEDIL
jgi:aspartate ammonia-lyase